MISFDFEPMLVKVIGDLSFENSMANATVTLLFSNPTRIS
jgi:hypothetical protein